MTILEWLAVGFSCSAGLASMFLRRHLANSRSNGLLFSEAELSGAQRAKPRFDHGAI